MSRIPVGRFLWIDTGMGRWGRVLYMVVNSPIVCETCNSVIFDWEKGDVRCPVCGHEIRERNYYPCPYCGEDDYVSVAVVGNDNFGYDIHTGEMTEYNDRLGTVLNVCGKSLSDDIGKGLVRLLSARETVDRKRNLVWVHQDGYDPSEKMPQWIIDKFRYEDQE